ncbi:hypothetical protein [Yoonia vestfoldensis]|uniref:hypothetical protein n=1 Tax=Yoonia vestfoldensis TaxID=245188 RepID=UPI0003251A51|nr:hypothetical protein [Yoonia vestfoldensis]
MKFKLTSGDSIFSFEGELSEAIALLDAYWKPQSRVHLVSANQDSASTDSPSKVGTKRRGKSTSTSTSGASTSPATLNAEELANNIKSNQHFDKIKSKILDKKGEWVTKCKMVAHFASAPITSGDVKRTMDAFRVKSELSTLSRALSNNSSLFLTKKEGSAVKYELTSSAEESFLDWLDSDTNE